jgi:hypothetical protein
MTSRLQDQRFSSRRRFLQRTLSGVAGWALWHGWPSQHRALAQEDVSEVLGCYSLRVYESPSNLQSNRVTS